MPTINSKALIDKVVAGNGHYYNDPVVRSIYEYTNGWGNRTYGVNYTEENWYEPSEYIINPTLYWKYDGAR